jgi:hypothetical protein
MSRIVGEQYRRRTRRSELRTLGGKTEVSEDAGGHGGVGNKREQGQAVAAARATRDIVTEHALEQQRR